MMNRGNTFVGIMILVCFCGCIYQVYYVSQNYFAYKTTTRVETRLNDLIRYPAIIICIKIGDFLKDSTTLQGNASGIDLLNLTIHQLYLKTPPENETIGACYLRTNIQKNLTKQPTVDICNNHFMIKKWILGFHVCYQFHPRHDLVYSISSIAGSLGYGLQVYEIHLNSAFNDVPEIFTPAYYPSIDEKPNLELWYPSDCHKFGDIVLFDVGHNSISFRPIAENFDLLPAPYDTGCEPMNRFCLRDCLINRTVTQFNRFPFVETANHIYGHLKILSSMELRMKEKSLKWKQIEQECHTLCSKHNCKMRIHSNNAHEFYLTNTLKIRLAAYVPSSYARTVLAVPQMNWVEYISGVCSSVSIWFGISAFSINPLKVRARVSIREINNRSKRYYNIVFYSMCTIGLVYQIIQVCINYFNYTTTTKVEVLTTDFYKYQSLSICFGYLRFLNRTNHKKYGFKPTLEGVFQDSLNQLSILTIKQIFELTPSKESFIASCGIRDRFYHHMNKISKQDCHRYFTYNRTLQGENLCFYATPRNDLKFSWTKAANSFLNQGQVYELSFTPGISDSKVIVTSYEATEEEPYPLLSRNFATKLMLDTPDPNEPDDNLITAYSFLNKYTSLHSPYDTKCVEDDEYTGCRKRCLDEKLTPIHRVHYAVTVSNISLDKKFLNFRDLENASVAKLVNSSEIYCNQKCSMTPCRQVISFTDAYSDYVKYDNNSLRIKSCVPSSPATHVFLV